MIDPDGPLGDAIGCLAWAPILAAWHWPELLLVLLIMGVAFL